MTIVKHVRRLTTEHLHVVVVRKAWYNFCFVLFFVSLLVTVGQKLWTLWAPPPPSQTSSQSCAQIRETGTVSGVFFGTWIAAQVSVLVLFFLSSVLLRCLGRAGRSSRGCRRQVTRRRTASCGGARGGRSEGTAELSDGTPRGTRRRSRHTCARARHNSGHQDLTVRVSVDLGLRYIQAHS